MSDWWEPPKIRRLLTYQELLAEGHTRGELRYGADCAAFPRVIRNVYAVGAGEVTPFDVALAHMVRDGSPAWGIVAARVYDLDAVHDLSLPPYRRRRATDRGGAARVVNGVLCVSPLQTMLELATLLDDERWEQANESALHKKLFTLDDELALLSDLQRTRTAGVKRMARVLALRPPGAPPTESRLETIAVQIARHADGVPEPTRQREVRNTHDEFVARVDLSWPELGGFLELDGLGHRNQPVYDASRESAVVNATGWLPNRMTWREAYNNRTWAARRMSEFLARVRQRPLT